MRSRRVAIAGLHELAFAAEPEDREVVHIRGEAEVIADALFELFEVGVPNLLDVAATGTDEVVVRFFRSPFEEDVASAHIGGGCETHALEHVERAVDGADIHEGVLAADLVGDLGGADVAPGVPEGADDEEALGGHFVARAAEEFGRFILTGHAVSLQTTVV